MKRYSDWESRLLEFIMSRAFTPFAWGKHDCSLFACDAVLAMTGTDIAADFRGRYTTKLGAAKVIREFVPSGQLSDLAEKRGGEKGLTEVGPRAAQRGDIVLLATDQETALGIVALDGRSAYTVAEVGYQKLPIKYWSRAWRVA
jgi:hypothetical protein